MRGVKMTMRAGRGIGSPRDSSCLEGEGNRGAARRSLCNLVQASCES